MQLGSFVDDPEVLLRCIWLAHAPAMHCKQQSTSHISASFCSSDSDEELSASHKENLSPTQLATRLQSLHIRPPRTSVKPLQPPSKGVHWPKAPQSLPPKAKHTQLPPSSPSISKAQSLARFKREREGLAYQLFQE